MWGLRLLFTEPKRLYQSAKALKFKVFTLGSMAAWLSPPLYAPRSRTS